MRVTNAFISLASYAALACGCSTSPSTAPTSPVSVSLSCTNNQSPADCLRPASELCGEVGYDLFDKSGKAISVADLKNKVATARCKR